MRYKPKNITARVFIRALEQDGYVFKRKSKSGHRIYKHVETGRRISVPYHHSGRTYPPGTLSRLIKATGWTDEDLVRLKLTRKG